MANDLDASKFLTLLVPVCLLAVQLLAMFLFAGFFGRLYPDLELQVARWGVVVAVFCLGSSVRSRRATKDLWIRVVLMAIITLSAATSLILLLGAIIVK